MHTVWVIALAWAALGLISASVLVPLWLRDRRRGTPWIGDDPGDADDVAAYYRSRFRVINGGLG